MHAGREAGGGGGVGWGGCVGGVEESTFCLAGLGAGYGWLFWQSRWWRWWWQRIGKGAFGSAKTFLCSVVFLSRLSDPVGFTAIAAGLPL